MVKKRIKKAKVKKEVQPELEEETKTGYPMPGYLDDWGDQFKEDSSIGTPGTPGTILFWLVVLGGLVYFGYNILK